ncbi:MAG: hypothetical protein JW881_03045 [Spirochaetales bacterium]|nr:hypothetical protein [Spirochaetales bacterium]
MASSCLSCGMLLEGNANPKAKEIYCTYCSDKEGNLLPREQVRQGIAGWLREWAPEKKNVDFLKRADHYMNSMPAWAD